MVESEPHHYAKMDVHMFLHVDVEDHTRDAEHANTITMLLHQQQVGQVHGCLAFWEDHVPLAALVAEKLQLSHAPSYRAALNAKSKYLTHSVLSQMEEGDASRYASPVARIDSLHDVGKAVETVGP